jgi:small subunit ribosomal protein S29
LQDLSPQNVKAYNDIQGRVMGLPVDLVDSLRAVEAFKVGQGWGFFKRPAMLIREEAVQIGRWMDDIMWTDDRIEGSGLEGIGKGSTVRRVIAGERKCGKSVLLLQAMANAFLRKWVVISLPEGMFTVLNFDDIILRYVYGPLILTRSF